MNVRNYGEVIFCKNIKFEDDQCDLEQGHPGVVLLPTNFKDEKVFCIYMTSDQLRAEKESEKYIYHEGKVISHINLSQIIETKNNKDKIISNVRDNEFMKLLKQFYNFQKLKEPHSVEFDEIEDKIKTLIELLQINKELGINYTIDADFLERVKDIENIKQLKRIYIAELKTLNMVNPTEIITTEKEKIYTERLIEAYEKIKNIDLDKINFEDLNNDVRNIYLKFKSNYFLINTDQLFSDVRYLFSDDINIKIDKFLEIERQLLENRNKKLENKRDNKKIKSKKASRQKRNNNNLKRKYGDFSRDFGGNL